MPTKPKELHPDNDFFKIEKWFSNFLKDKFQGKPPVLVKKKAETGGVNSHTKELNSATKSKITKRINKILAVAETAKIGASGDTTVRMGKKDYRSSYDFVERIFCSKSEAAVIKAEVHFIKKFKKSHPEQIKNIREVPAPSLISYNGKFYLYVVYNRKATDEVM